MKSFLLASALLASAVSISAAGPTDDTFAKSHPRIHEVDARLDAQDKRIDHALAAGKITAGQAAALHAEDASIKAAEATDTALDTGHLTKADDKALNQQLNVVSKQIGGDTHPRLAEVNARLDAQDKRIDSALAAGKISADQAAALHAKDASIKTEEKTDASLDKGHLTKADDKALNQQLNVVSKQIAGDTHPRLTEINARLAAQDKRIDSALAAGKISADQAVAFHAEDASIKAEETIDASLDKGHLTKADDKALNQQLNAVSTQIGGDTHPRLAEINARLDAQDKRIDAALAAGRISAADATAFHADDAKIKADEKTEKSLDDGHITHAEQQSLNQEISGVGHEIGSAAGAKSSGKSSGSGSHGSSRGGHK